MDPPAYRNPAKCAARKNRPRGSCLAVPVLTRLKLQIEHSRQALTLARERYSDGVRDFLTVLDAERTLLQADQQCARSTTNVSLNFVQLFKALGGGWEPTFPGLPGGGSP